MPMKNPPHPGDLIRTEIIEPAGLSVTGGAAALQVFEMAEQIFNIGIGRSPERSMFQEPDDAFADYPG